MVAGLQERREAAQKILLQQHLHQQAQQLQAQQQVAVQLHQKHQQHQQNGFHHQ